MAKRMMFFSVQLFLVCGLATHSPLTCLGWSYTKNECSLFISLLSCHAEALGTCAFNLFISGLYGEGYWVHRDVAIPLAACCEKFSECFGRCSDVCYQRGLHRFHGVPKSHSLCHFPLRMREEAARSEYVVNCLSESVQMQEDFIGRPSRLSRRVSPKALHLRCVQRYLIGAYHALLESDQDSRGLWIFSGVKLRSWLWQWPQQEELGKIKMATGTGGMQPQRVKIPENTK